MKTEQKTILRDYITSCLEKGHAISVIMKRLQYVGWTREQIENTYRDILITSGIPVPDGRNVTDHNVKRATVLDIVMQIFSFFILGIVAVSSGVLLYGIINMVFPDTVTDIYDPRSLASVRSVHYAISTLIIGYPSYVLVMRMWLRKGDDTEKYQESAITKWLTYIVLLLASMIIMGDGITMIFYILQGELSVRFFLKAVTILVIAGGIFGLYYHERKKMQYHHMIAWGIFRRFAVFYGIFFSIVIMTGMFVTGSPQAQRERTLDTKRSEDLAMLAQCIASFANQYEHLPVDLDDLYARSSYCSFVQDPLTGQAYKYRVIVAQKREGDVQSAIYELCADFSRENHMQKTGAYVTDHKWHVHGAGHICIQDEVVTKNFTSYIQ